MIKQLLNSIIAKFRQIIDLPATDKSRYVAQPRPIIVNYFTQPLVARDTDQTHLA